MSKLTLNHISKIYGHAKLAVKIEAGQVSYAKLEVFEGARYFEALLKGRYYFEVGEITSRICGTCSAAHMTNALYAIEKALGIEASEQTRLLRELLCVASIIQNQAMHSYFFALPDYLGYGSALAMADRHKEKIDRALKLKQLGNELVTAVGGREIHPITAEVGGFSKLPERQKLKALLKKLIELKKEATATAKLFSQLNYPEFERATEYIALRGETYAGAGDIITSRGTRFVPEDYKNFLQTYTTPYSTSKFVVEKGKSYVVGPLARVNLNMEMLSEDAKAAIEESGIEFPNRNPFITNFARSTEMIHFFDRAAEIIRELKIEKEPKKKIKLKPCSAVAALEAPRGVLFHEYELNKKGSISRANIITPTAQNLRNIEEDVKAFLPSILNKPKESIVLELEKLIRAYDPCISCSTHFLQVKWL
jgi:coenzyme F420-reducing hydrogenase alpha subunit